MARLKFTRVFFMPVLSFAYATASPYHYGHSSSTKRSSAVNWLVLTRAKYILDGFATAVAIVCCVAQGTDCGMTDDAAFPQCRRQSSVLLRDAWCHCWCGSPKWLVHFLQLFVYLSFVPVIWSEERERVFSMPANVVTLQNHQRTSLFLREQTGLVWSGTVKYGVVQFGTKMGVK